MNGYFENKVAAVTGAASGIALGMTEHLLSRGSFGRLYGGREGGEPCKEADRLRNLYPGKAFLSSPT
ncbi:hypothetical protein MASR1M66_05890 [Aminivibrio sp.]